MFVMRFDMRLRDGFASAAALYRAALEMAQWGEQHGAAMAMVSEHHASSDGYLPAPLVLASALAARTTKLPIQVAALLVPLHDPIELAEQMAVLDIVSLVLLAVFVGALLERSFNVAATNLIEFNRSNTNLRVPLAWSQIPWFAGILLFFLTIIVAILRSIGALLRGDLATVNATAGVSSQDEEIESELKGLGIERPHAEKA